MTLNDLLRTTVHRLNDSSPSPRLDAELLLGHVLGCGRGYLFAHGSDAVDNGVAEALEPLVAERMRGRPVAQLIGTQEFWSLELTVDEHTLIPRPETETLVEQALARLPASEATRCADLGTGSGAIALAIASERPQCEVIATDVSDPALRVARANADRLNIGNVTFITSDWYAELNGERFDIIASNPPYVARSETDVMSPETAFEPESALFASDAGLADIRRIVGGAGEHLKPDGWLLLEHGYTQSDAVLAILSEAGFTGCSAVADLAGHPRVALGQWPNR